MPRRHVLNAMNSLSRLRAEEMLADSATVGVGFGGDKDGHIVRGWQRAARGEQAEPKRRGVASGSLSVAAQQQVFGRMMGIPGGVVKYESEQAFVEEYLRNEREHAERVAAGIEQPARRLGR